MKDSKNQSAQNEIKSKGISQEHSQGHFKRAILEIIAAGIGNTREDLLTFTACTLFWTQKGVGAPTFDLIEAHIKFLLEYEFIRLQESEGDARYVSTRLGSACLASSMPPNDGFLLFSELQKSRQCFVLETDLHAVYLVTPYSVCGQLNDLNWRFFIDLWERLPAAAQRVGQLIGIKESFLIKAMLGKALADQKQRQIHTRFFVALALQELVNEVPLTRVSKRFGLSRGTLQSLQQSCSTFAGIVTAFCSSLNWTLLAMIVGQFRERLFFGVHPDLLDLMRAPSLNGQRARALFKAGVTTLIELANADVLRVENILLNAVSFETDRKREDENEFEANRRKQLRNIFITGKSGLTARAAAELLINEARRFLELEMGVAGLRWDTTGPQKRIASPNSSIEPPPKQPKRKTHSMRLRNSPQNTPDLFESSDSSLNLSNDPQDASLFHSSLLTHPASFEQLNIATISLSARLFNAFLDQMSTISTFALSLGVRSTHDDKPRIGANLRPQHRPNPPPAPFLPCGDTNLSIAGAAICFEPNSVYYFDFEAPRVSTADDLREACFSWLLDALRKPGVTLRVYDAKEQLKVLAQSRTDGIQVEAQFEDPRVAHWLLRPDADNSIGEMVKEFLTRHQRIVGMLPEGRHFGSVALNWRLQSCVKLRSCVESCLTFHLMDRLKEQLQNFGPGYVDKAFTAIEMPIQLALFRMESVGFPVDPTALAAVTGHTLQLQKRVESKIYELNGKPFNLASSREVARVLGLHNGGRGRAPSTAKQVLEKLDVPMADLIMQYRKLETALGKCLEPLSKLAKVSEGRVRGSSFSFTSTGRISMVEPNLQNVPKDFVVAVGGEEVTVSCRSAFRPRTPGRSLLSADFCQLEMRILTHLSQDRSLIAAIAGDEDIFRAIAARWHRCRPDAVAEKLRNDTKQICYGIIYGMGVKSLAEAMRVDEEEAARTCDEFHRAYPGLKAYTDAIVRAARERGYVETLTGRRRHLPRITEAGAAGRHAERQAINTTIQGSAADIAKSAILRMERELKRHEAKLRLEAAGVDFVLHLHDELVYEVSTNKLKAVAKLLRHSMETCVKLSVPLPVRVKAGPSWAELGEFSV